MRLIQKRTEKGREERKGIRFTSSFLVGRLFANKFHHGIVLRRKKRRRGGGVSVSFVDSSLLSEGKIHTKGKKRIGYPGGKKKRSSGYHSWGGVGHVFFWGLKKTENKGMPLFIRWNNLGSVKTVWLKGQRNKTKVEGFDGNIPSHLMQDLKGLPFWGGS